MKQSAHFTSFVCLFSSPWFKDTETAFFNAVHKKKVSFIKRTYVVQIAYLISRCENKCINNIPYKINVKKKKKEKNDIVR